MFIHTVSSVLLLTAGAPATLDVKEREDFNRFPKRMQFLIDSLRRCVPLEKPLEAPLQEIIDYLEDVASPAESARDPSVRVKIIADDPAFRELKGPKYNVKDADVSLPKLAGGHLETMLTKICEQIDGVIVVRHDHLELTTFQKVFGRDRRKGEAPILVCHAAFREPVADLLQALAARHLRTIALSEQAASLARTKVTVQLLNLPLDAAVETLAEMAGLKALRKGNAYLVTTVDHARALIATKKGEALPGDWEKVPETKGATAVPKQE